MSTSPATPSLAQPVMLQALELSTRTNSFSIDNKTSTNTATCKDRHQFLDIQDETNELKTYQSH